MAKAKKKRPVRRRDHDGWANQTAKGQWCKIWGRSIHLCARRPPKPDPDDGSRWVKVKLVVVE